MGFVGGIAFLIREVMHDQCPVCNSRDLDYDYHGYNGSRPVCNRCGWDSDKDNHIASDLDDAFLEKENEDDKR